MGNSLRTREMVEKYRQHVASGQEPEGCALCAKPVIKAFNHWKAIPNDFPYDVIAATHHMIVPIRHVTEPELTDEEREEFVIIKNTFIQEYDYIIEGTHRIKSIPAHFHLHLIVGKGPQY